MTEAELFALVASDVASRVERRRRELESAASGAAPRDRLAAAQAQVRRGAAELAAALAAADALEKQQAYEAAQRVGRPDAAVLLAAWREAEQQATAKANEAAQALAAPAVVKQQASPALPQRAAVRRAIVLR